MILFLLLSCGSDHEPAEYACSVPESDHPRAAELQVALEQAHSLGLPGVMFTTSGPDGTFSGAAGYADLQHKTALKGCERTRIASVTKTFVSTTVLRMVDSGELDLDATIDGYLPEDLRAQVEYGDIITVRQLLNHTAGTHDFIDFNWVMELLNDPERTYTTQDNLDRAFRIGPDAEPGGAPSYSNTNYLLLGRIIEHVRGRPHDAVMQDEVFVPLGLERTTYQADVFEFDDVLRGYFDIYGELSYVDSTETYAINGVDASGGVASTPQDLDTLLVGLFRDKSLLSDDTLLEMQQWEAIPGEEGEYPSEGLGLARWSTRYGEGVGHLGDEFGYSTMAWYFPERDTTFVAHFNASALAASKSEDNATGVIYDGALPLLLDALFAE